MTACSADPGSFRDPGGRVFVDGDRVLRAIYPSSGREYEAFRNSGLLDNLVASGRLLESEEIDPRSSSAGANAEFLLQHPRLPFVSYPYEWSFSLHKRAALLQLDLLLEALERGFTLSDATAYNIQFLGCEARFIDHLSFRRYRDGEIWAAHRQFCMQFLNPLVMWSRLGVAPNSWFRGSLEGIPPEDLSRLLRLRDRLSWTILAHVSAQGAAERRAKTGEYASAGANTKLPRDAFKAMLLGLRSFVSNSKLPAGRSVWDAYPTHNSYRTDETEAKHRFVSRMVEATKPALLFDLGCNTGDYAATALRSGARYVVGFDFDFGALERAVERASREKLPFLPLWLDATNPSPAQGWNEHERLGFGDRAKGGAVLALAFIHHLAIAKNIPLDRAVDWIMSVAPVGVVEFPPKSDPMVQRLLARREDIFANYDEGNFLAEVGKRGRIVEQARLSDAGRLMVWYDRTAN